jgi:hypothetical protein
LPGAVIPACTTAGEKGVAVAALRPGKGTVRQTSFPPEAEKELHRGLKKRI